MEEKKLWQSKTVWFAIAQAVVSVLVVVLTELDLVGYIGIVKSVADVVLRLITEDPVIL